MMATKATVSAAAMLLMAATAVDAVSMYVSESGGDFHNPARLVRGQPDLTLTLKYDDLPGEGEAAKIPWVGSYWPKFRDSVNSQWDGEGTQSPVAKYAAAFGVDPAVLEDAISMKIGLAGQRFAWPKPAKCGPGLPACSSGRRCATRRGETEGICVESWEGICHAWAAAACAEEEPRRAVTRNGVTFKVNDLKALVTLMYTVGRVKNYMSYPCKKNGAVVKFDQWGRPSANDFECADTNPGAFHTIAANLLGVHKRAFVEDRTWDEQVWNQPVRGFKVLETRKVTNAKEAMREVAKGENRWSRPLVAEADLPDNYIFNADAKSWVVVKMNLRYITESAHTADGFLGDRVDRFTITDTYTYLLELDVAGEIIGGEWLQGSKRDHPDFLTLTTGRTNEGMVGMMAWADVKSLIDESTTAAPEATA